MTSPPSATQEQRRRQADASQVTGWRDQLWVAVIGSVCAAGMLVLVIYAWRGSPPGVNDFYREALPAYHALFHGHVLGFIRAAPAYVGSLVLRAPFALIASAAGADRRGVYVATSLPCLLVAPIFGAWLAAQSRPAAGAGLTSRVSPIVLCAVNPIVVICLILGHPEDVLGATLCAAALVLATRGSPGWCGVMLGLALINKSWALVAVPVVLAAMPSGRRRALLTVAVTAGSVLVPVLLARQSAASVGGAATSLGGTVGTIFLAPQLLWWFGRHAWIVQQSHYLIVIVATGSSLLWWAIRRTRPAADRTAEAALLLAFVLLLRGALDPLDVVYYYIPFLFALMLYEAGQPPRLTALYTCLLLLVVPPQVLNLTADAHAGAFAAVALPTIIWLAARLYLPPRATPVELIEGRPAG